MNGLFFLVAANIAALALTVFGGMEFHEAAGILALQLSSVGFFLTIITALDLVSLLKMIKPKEEDKENE